MERDNVPSTIASVDRRLDAPAALPVSTIEPPQRWPAVNWSELLAARELLYFFFWRDLKIRYKQTVLGAGWAVIKPLLHMLLMTFVFGLIAGIPADGIPYPVFFFTALVPWMFFSAAIGASANSVLSNGSILKKVYYPRLLMPISAILNQTVDFFISFAILAVMIAAYLLSPGIYDPKPMIPGRHTLALPLYFGLLMITLTGAGLWLAALNAVYRDVQCMLNFILMAWLYLSPVAYPLSLVPQPWQTIMAANPMVSVIEGFRACLLHRPPVPPSMLLLSTVVAILFLVSGVRYFRRLEAVYPDLV